MFEFFAPRTPQRAQSRMGTLANRRTDLDRGRGGRQGGYVSVENFPDFVGKGS